jgi:hypothetical protein
MGPPTLVYNLLFCADFELEKEDAEEQKSKAPYVGISI